MDILESNRSYDCFCGKDAAFDFAASYILEHTDITDVTSLKIAVVSDRIVSGYYYNRFENQFINRGIKPVLISVEAANNSKSLASADSVFRYLSDFAFGRNDWIIGLGGGGIIDLSGFVSSVFSGGIRYMAVPTTLNAMTEGIVASRAHLNSMGQKDYISADFRPDVAIVDPVFLDTVPAKVKTNGFASVIRYGILQDPSLILELDKKKPGDIREFLCRVYAARATVEKKDPDLLKLGDEVAYAIESYFRFMNYSEGEALALSLLGVADEKRRQALIKIYEVLGLPVKLKDVSPEMIIKTMADRIRRTNSGLVRTVDLDSEGGRWVVRDMPPEDAIALFRKRIETIGDR